jgi:hypothetical protein
MRVLTLSLLRLAAQYFFMRSTAMQRGQDYRAPG